MNEVNRTDHSYKIASLEMNVEVFGDMLKFYSSDVGSKWMNPRVLESFLGFHEDEKISILSTDMENEDKTMIMTVNDKDSHHVALLLNSGYFLGFQKGRSQELVNSILDTAVSIKRAVETVDELVSNRSDFMSRIDFYRYYNRALQG